LPGQAFCWPKRADGGNLSRYWILLLVLFIYGPILIAQISDPSTGVKVEGSTTLRTLLFAGAILALASATPSTD